MPEQAASCGVLVTTALEAVRKNRGTMQSSRHVEDKGLSRMKCTRGGIAQTTCKSKQSRRNDKNIGQPTHQQEVFSKMKLNHRESHCYGFTKHKQNLHLMTASKGSTSQQLSDPPPVLVRRILFETISSCKLPIAHEPEQATKLPIPQG